MYKSLKTISGTPLVKSGIMSSMNHSSFEFSVELSSFLNSFAPVTGRPLTADSPPMALKPL
jgi:hypothetical protein